MSLAYACCWYDEKKDNESVDRRKEFYFNYCYDVKGVWYPFDVGFLLNLMSVDFIGCLYRRLRTKKDDVYRSFKSIAIVNLKLWCSL